MNDSGQVSIDLATVHGWVWTVALILIAFALYRGRPRDGSFRPTLRHVPIVIAIVLVAAIVPAGLGRVQPGARGVVLRFGAPTGRVVGEGLYYVVPLVDRVVQVNTQINTVTFDRAQALTRDLEPVYADLATTFHVEPAHVVEVYSLLRDAYATRVVQPAVQEAWKSTAAHYAASDIVLRHDDVQRDFTRGVRDRLAHFGLGLDALSTTRLDFSFAYSQAAQEKVASVQHTLQAEQDLQRIRFESQQNVIRAKSEVDALKLQRNIPAAQLIQMRRLDLERRAIDKWDGHLPTTTATTPFIGSALGTDR